MAESTTSNNKRIAKNTLFLYFRMLLTMAVSLYTSRVVLDALGVEDFGIYNVVGGVVAMFGFINTSMASATQRFMSFSLGRDSCDLLRKTFSTSLFIHLLISVVVFILSETIGLWFLWNKMQIPVERMDAAFWVFQCSIFAMIIMIISVPYNALIIAHEKMGTFAYISILETILKLTVAILVLHSSSDKLIFYAFLLLLMQLFIRSCYRLYCNRHFKESRFVWKFEKPLFKEMLSFSVWTMNGNLAIIGYTQGLNILLNVFFGPAVNAARGVAVQVQDAVYRFSQSFLMAVNPQITKAYSKGDLSYMHQLLIKSSKYSYFLLLIISLPILFQSYQLLSWWLKDVPEYADVFLRIILCVNMLSVLSRPIVTSIHATGKIKQFQIIEGSILLCIVPISYILLSFFNCTPSIVFLVHLFVELIALYARIKIVFPKIKMNIKVYNESVILPIIKVSLVVAILPFMCSFIMDEQDIYSFVVITFICIISSVISIYFIGCSNQERLFIRTHINEYLRKLKNRT